MLVERKVPYSAGMRVDSMAASTAVMSVFLMAARKAEKMVV